jgi:hypothetical protein
MRCSPQDCGLHKLPFIPRYVTSLDFGRKPNFFEQSRKSKMSKYIENLTQNNHFQDLETTALIDHRIDGFHFVVPCTSVFHVCLVKCKCIQWDVLRLLFLGNRNQFCHLCKIPKSILLYIISFIEIDAELETCDTSIQDIRLFQKLTNDQLKFC